MHEQRSAWNTLSQKTKSNFLSAKRIIKNDTLGCTIDAYGLHGLNQLTEKRRQLSFLKRPFFLTLCPKNPRVLRSLARSFLRTEFYPSCQITGFGIGKCAIRLEHLAVFQEVVESRHRAPRPSHLRCRCSQKKVGVAHLIFVNRPAGPICRMINSLLCCRNSADNVNVFVLRSRFCFFLSAPGKGVDGAPVPGAAKPRTESACGVEAATAKEANDDIMHNDSCASF